MNILSLFDGISCGRVALERAGITVEKYFASEIEMQPIQISKMNWPDIIQLGDVTAWDAWIRRLPKIDLLIGGSPCFVAGTKVICESGVKNIEDIVVGDKCLSHDGKYHRVSAIGNELKKVWVVKNPAFNDFEIYSTETHPFYVCDVSTGKISKKPLCELTENDFIGLRKEYSLPDQKFLKLYPRNEDYKAVDFWVNGCSITNTETYAIVYNITVDDTHTYFAEGVLVSNCQDLSMLGAQRGLTEGSGTRSSLFHTMKAIYFWLLKNNNPDCHILLENVFTKPQWEQAITDELRLAERMGDGYQPTKINSSLVSAQMRPRNYWASWNTTIPKDKNIKLQDILEHGFAYQEKSNALLKSYTGSSVIHSFKYKVNTLVAELAEPDYNNHVNNKTSRAFQVTNGYVEIPVLNARTRIGTREFEKYHFPVMLADGWYTFREFTARETERLQTLPDNYCKNVPLKWVQEATGNGWTVDVIAHLFRDLVKQYPHFLQPLHK